MKNFPQTLKPYLEGKKVTKITKAHRSGDLVYKIENMYILKVSKNIERLTKEKNANDYLKDYLNVSHSILFFVEDNTAYYLKSNVQGIPLVSKKFLKNPDLLVYLLAEAIKLFHNTIIDNCIIKNSSSTGEVLVHGDFCLPNIIIGKNNKIGFIDLEDAGLGDPWIDYAWAIWSLEYNLKTTKYKEKLLNLLNIEFDQKKYNMYTKI